MNLLLFEPAEVVRQEQLRVVGERALHLFAVKKVRPGSKIQFGVIDKGFGNAEIVSASRGEILLQVLAFEEQCQVLNSANAITLILALPRPQILKKVLQTTAMMGVEKLILVGAAKTEKSYFNSKLLLPEELRRHLTLGLEQAVAIRCPEVVLCRRFKELDEAVVKARTNELRICADPKGESFARQVSRIGITSSAEVVLAIGPEGGWQSQEIQALEASGFLISSFGERILRVDTAVPVCLSQIELIRELRAPK